ncbi:MAG: hypothetical protein KC416_01160 [Myxococcales bacterium]|nr:hypothetical protein [Myxococcales bacterium]
MISRPQILGGMFQVALAVFLFAVPTQAQPETAGALRVHVPIRGADIGAGVLGDLGWNRRGLLGAEWFWGGSIGAVVISSDDADRSRAMMPIALSTGLLWRWPVWLSLRIRAGAWVGALNAGLRAGGFGSAGGSVGLPIGRDVAISLGADAWLMLLHDDAIVLSPSIGFVWVPASPAEK